MIKEWYDSHANNSDNHTVWRISPIDWHMNIG
jgi:hypothetical protein